MTAMWMTSASFCGLVLAFSGYFRKRFPRRLIFFPYVLGVLLVITVLCKSSGALFLLIMATGVFFSVRILRWPLLLLVLLALPLLYMVTRGTGSWDAQNLIAISAKAANQERAGSLEYRINNENILIDKAIIRPWLGWGRWRRSYVRDENGEMASVPDGLWILVFGQEGLLGLTFLTATLSLPILLFMGRYPPSTWRQPEIAALTALPILLGIFMIDNLFNNMFNPAFLLVSGGLAGHCSTPDEPDLELDDGSISTELLPQKHRTRAL